MSVLFIYTVLEQLTIEGILTIEGTSCLYAVESTHGIITFANM